MRRFLDALWSVSDWLVAEADSVSGHYPDDHRVRQARLCRCPRCGTTRLVALTAKCQGRTTSAMGGREVECGMLLLTDSDAVGPVEVLR